MTAVIYLCCGLFAIGLYGVLTRREVIGVLASVEVMLGAANVLLIGLSSAAGAASVTAGAQATGVIVVVVAAAEAAVGLALVIAALKRTGRQTVDEFTEVKG